MKNEEQDYNFTQSTESFTMKFAYFKNNGTLVIEFSEDMID